MGNKETIGLKSIIVKYLHHWKLFVIAFCISLIPAILYLIFYPKTYEIISRIQIQDEEGSSGMSLSGDAAGMMKSFGLGGISGGSILIDDEMAILESHDLMRDVVVKLGLNAKYLKPFSWEYKMYDHLPLLMEADSTTLIQQDKTYEFVVKVAADGSVVVKGDNGNETKRFNFTSLPADLEWNNNHFRLSQGPAYKTGEKINLTIEMSPPGWVADDLLKEINIDTYSKNSNLIEFFYKDYERRRGYDLLTTLVDEYNKRADEVKRKITGSEIVFLNERLEETVTNLLETERKIEIYKMRNQITDIEYDIQFYSEQMKDIQSKLIELEMQSHSIRLLEEFVSDPKNEYNLVPSVLGMEEGDKSPIQTYNELLVERERMLQNTNPNNPTLASLEKQLKQLRSNVYLTIQNAQKSLNYAIRDVKVKEKSIFDRMDKVPTQEREYLDYQRQKEIYQGIYLILLQMREDAMMKIGRNIDRALVVDKAFASSRPVAPRKLFAALFMMLFTIAVPVGYLFCKEQYLDLKDEFLKTRK